MKAPLTPDEHEAMRAMYIRQEREREQLQSWLDDEGRYSPLTIIAAAFELLEHLKIAMEYLPHVSLEWAKKARATITKAESES